MINRVLFVIAAFLFGFASTTCFAEAPPTEKIIDGTPSSADSYPYVVRIEYQGDILCTGTLVGTRYVLTAAHCFFGDSQQREVGDTDLILRFGSSQTVRSSKVHIHPDYRSREGACYDGETDAAVVVLAREVSGVSPIPMISSSISAGDSVFLAGFGTQGNGNTGEDGSVPDVGTVNVGYASVDGFGENPPSQDDSSSYFYWKFISGESNTASGDSGGPAFIDVNGQRHLAGITCGGYGNSEFGTYSLDTRVEKIKSWVESYFTSAPPTARSMSIKSAELYYDNARDDYLHVRGQITVGSGFRPRGKLVTVKIGSYSKQVRLNADAEAGNSKFYFGLTGTFRGSAFRGSVVRYDVEFERLPVFQELPGLGFPVSSQASAYQEAVLPISITVDGNEVSASSILSFRSRGEVWKVKPGQ